MTEFFALLPKLKELFEAGASLAEDVSEPDGSVNVDIIVSLLRKRAEGWQPEFKGVKIFDVSDPGTKEAGIRFMAGLAIRAAGKKVHSPSRAKVGV